MKENIFNIVEKLLKSNNDYIAEDGKLLKAKVYSDIMTMNPELIALLLTDNDVVNRFFVRVNETLVFDKQKFAWFIDSKEFLPDSYTKYSNKIGLTTNGSFIFQSNDVVLDFPYKDCVLEGGQDKEDQKRDEIFFHETIASDEITKMLAPKVFTNAKRYTKDGVEENIEFYENDNLIIKGNNLIAISSLLKRYEGKVKCIYLDPPYNTPGDDNIFSYNNTFNHSTWLTFIKNRLNIAKKLLSNNGFITIAIDHNELFYLGVLCDEVLGKENFISIITVQHNPKGRNQAKFISSNSEFLLIYAKDKAQAKFQTVAISDDVKSTFTERDDIGLYRWESYIRARSEWSKEARPDNWYPIYISENYENLSTIKTEGSFEVYPVTNTGDFSWKNVKETFDLLNREKDYFRARIENDKIIIEHKYRENEVLKNVWIDKKYQSEFNGTNLLKDLIGKNDFSYPKSVYAVQDIIKIMSGDGDIVLDFFAGSGTTAHAVLLANAEQGFNRKFILCEQLDEHINIINERLNKLLNDCQSDNEKKYLVGNSFEKFAYCELMENSQELIDLITQSTAENIKEIKNRIYSDERIISYITKEELQKADDFFEDLSLEEKKIALIKLINKNKLYVNYSDIEDENYNISEADKLFTKSFYSKN